MEAPGHAGIEFPFIVVGAVEVSFKFKPQAAVVAEFGRNAGADIVPRIVVDLIEAQAFQAVNRCQVIGAIPGKFMENIGLEVPSLVSVDVTAEAEAQSADEAVDAVEVLADAVIAPEIVSVNVRILELTLRFDIPGIVQDLLAAPFDAGLLVPGTEGALRFVTVEKSCHPFAVHLPNATDDVEVMAVLSEPSPVQAARIAFVFPISFIKGGLALEVTEGQALTKKAAIISVHRIVVAEFKAVAVAVIAVAADMAVGPAGPHARIFSGGI